MGRAVAIAVVCGSIGVADLVCLDAWLLPAWAASRPQAQVVASVASSGIAAEPPRIATALAEVPALVTPQQGVVATREVVAPRAPVPDDEPAIVSSDAVARAETVARTEPAVGRREPIYFPHTGTAALDDAARAQLQAVALRLRDDAKLHVRVHGHADARGTKRINYGLSRRRAEAVARGLREQGIAGSRISLAWSGELRPAVKGSGEAAWAANRRVEIELRERR